MWLNEKHIGKGLGHESLPITTGKYLSENRKNRLERVDKQKNIPKFLYGKDKQSK